MTDARLLVSQVSQLKGFPARGDHGLLITIGDFTHLLSDICATERLFFNFIASHHSFIHLINTQSVCYLPGALLGPGYLVVNKTNMGPGLTQETYF